MMTTDYRCRKCRAKLFTKESLITCHNEPLDGIEKSSENPCYNRTSNVLFVDEQKTENWMKKQIDSGEWIKGRLTCPTEQCLARLGSFNFVNGESCFCGDYQLPSIQINRSKVDEPIKLFG